MASESKTPESSQESLRVTFIRSNRITYSENGRKYIMSLTKTVQNIIYFGCINRYSDTSRKPKCTATGIYNSTDKSYRHKKDHIKDCGEKSSTIIQGFYEIQKNFLYEELNKNPRLTAAPALDLLRKANLKTEPENKPFPLTYDQVKHIIDLYRKENGVNNMEGLGNRVVLTKDNSIFLRYNSSFYSIYKSNFSIF